MATDGALYEGHLHSWKSFTGQCTHQYIFNVYHSLCRVNITLVDVFVLLQLLPNTLHVSWCVRLMGIV